LALAFLVIFFLTAATISPWVGQPGGALTWGVSRR
jgi:hypothetical protein